MFWGLIMEPFKRYSQTVKKSFHISNAAIDASTGDNEMCQVMVGSQGKDFLVCTLQKGKILQTPLDLYFKEGGEISFTTSGKCVVHLTGYLDPDIYDEDEEEALEEEEDENIPELTPIDKKKRKADFSPAEQNNKKQKKEQEKKKKKENAVIKEESSTSDESGDEEEQLAKLLEDDETDSNDESYIPNDTSEVSIGDEDSSDDDDDDDDDDDVDESEEEQPSIQESPKEKQKKDKKEKNKIQQNVVNEQSKESVEKSSQETKEKKVLPRNVAIEDLKVGQGNVAKPGKMVQVYYEGRLKNNNKMFDNCLKGPGFKFRLGKKEVIAGWDVGVAGMKVGGKRRIICPPGMAYGKKGSPPVIPPNSTLVFEVELKGVN